MKKLILSALGFAAGSLAMAQTQPGNYCGGPSNPLTGLYTIPMNNFNYLFSDNGSTAAANNVGIGFNCADVLGARLGVKNPVMNVGVAVQTTKSTPTNYGVRASALNATTQSFGVWGEANSTTPSLNAGVYGHGANAIQTSYGGQFVADGTSNNVGVSGTVNGPTTNFGVLANSSGGTNNFGVNTTASPGSAGGNSYALYATNPGTQPNHWAGYFNGDVNINGQAFCTANVWSSDKRFKKNIEPIGNMAEKLARITAYTYDYRTDEFKDKRFPQGKQIGFIAQELKEVFPELVTESTDGYNYVNYVGMIPVLLQAIKEQQKQIDELKQAQLVNPASASRSVITAQSVQLSDAASIVLDQNVPNPFAEQTTIVYALTQDVKKAQMLFYNNEGRLINSVNLDAKPGKAALQVFASDLTSGVYTYSLVVDGKVIDSKRMVKQD